MRVGTVLYALCFFALSALAAPAVPRLHNTMPEVTGGAGSPTPCIGEWCLFAPLFNGSSGGEIYIDEGRTDTRPLLGVYIVCVLLYLIWASGRARKNTSRSNSPTEVSGAVEPPRRGQDPGGTLPHPQSVGWKSPKGHQLPHPPLRAPRAPVCQSKLGVGTASITNRGSLTMILDV
ncbi:hypothetical protein FB451DRAFT_1573789 [Mycena latifolia]|nr:hypothetical protein FB451DRAFT_1573789 [Mycena latifolia]